ncbi:class I adenylate-forming enzyme family protein [Albidovulum sediminis]|uniref:Acyl--CoA ligase n=1 Tax=Albidovulum sediminis TaxID=3066345 RepID=A0ABT2NIV5_9RHOB|nr:class I adenylate-forming enzyme family protein [Defluviimonas sediminis]MCT8328848.1 acyl--CoA ligase [Defluviimonas sediminis]
MPSPSRNPAPLPLPASLNLAEHVLARAETLGDKVALQLLRPSGAERWSYARLSGAVRGVATGLLERGLAPGDRVLLRLGNGVEFPLAFLGAIAAGLVPVVASSQLTQPEVERIARDLAPRLTVAGAGIARPEGIPALEASALMEMEGLSPAAFATGDSNRPAYAVYTSGTSGAPRAVLHAHRAILARALMFEGWYGLRADDRMLHAGAMNWTYTLGTGLLDPWTLGATALVPAAGVTADQIPLLMKRFDATIFAAAPGVYRQLLKYGARLALPRLRHGLSAGEKLPEATRAAWMAATGTPVHEAFGMSECSTFLSGSPARHAPAGTLGYPQAGRHVGILDDEGHPVAHGAEGTIAVHRSDLGLFLTYADAPDEAAARFRGDWFLTGDRAVATVDGAFRYLGRADDMMNAGGYRVSPAEVEAAFADAPGLEACAAFEARVKADTTVIALAHCGTASEQNLEAAAARALARYKQPRLYLRRDSLPRTATGKTNRRALREEWEKTH